MLKQLGIAATVDLPGRHFQGWVAVDRAEELRPVLPPLESHHQDNILVFAELNRAARPLTTDDLVSAAFRVSGETRTDLREKAVRVRLLDCLRRHRIDGLVSTVTISGRRAFGWVLTKRLAEFSRRPNRPIKVGSLDNEIRAAMASSGELLSAAEIIQRVLAGELPRKDRGIWTRRAVQNRVYEFIREQRRFGNVRQVRVNGKKGQRWELVSQAENTRHLAA